MAALPPGLNIMNMACQMKLNNLEFPVRLGWGSDERAGFQMVSINIELVFPEPPAACQNDRLEDTICYHRLTEQLRDYLGGQSFRLIEYLTRELYCRLRELLPAGIGIQVQTTKKPAIKELTQGVSFTYGDLS